MNIISNLLVLAISVAYWLILALSAKILESVLFICLFPESSVVVQEMSEVLNRFWQNADETENEKTE